MEGGAITGNVRSNVSIGNGLVFTMKSGDISGSTGGGSGVYLKTGATLIREGGTIDIVNAEEGGTVTDRRQ